MSKRLKTFACRYYHGGKWWAIDLLAENEDDARARASKLGLGNLRLLGEVKAQIPANIPGAGMFVRLFVGLANRFRRT
jgi:hypothetical protein